MTPLFHTQYTNNFSVVLANRGVDLTTLKNNRRTLLEHLNQASYGLQRFISSRLDDPTLPQYLAAEEQQVLAQLCRNWREQIDLGNSFLTYDYAEVCIELLAQAQYPLLGQLRSRRYQPIVQRFVAIPMACKAFVRVSSFLDTPHVAAALDRLTAALQARPALYTYIERIEIARTDFPLTLETGETDYPSFSLFLDQQAVQSRHHPLIGELVALVAQLTDGLPHRPLQADFSHAATSTVMVSQGYRNYKKYLRLIDQLDAVYCQRTNYAYLH
jgi:hypothetical protein